MSGALAAVANMSGVAFLSDFAAVSAPAATSCCTTRRLLLPGIALQQTVLTSAAVLVDDVSILHAATHVGVSTCSAQDSLLAHPACRTAGEHMHKRC
jgi:hypothetical protein